MRWKPSSIALAALFVLVLAALPLSSQEEPSAEEAAMMEAWMKAGTPGEAHERLARAEGTWKMVIKTWMDPAAPPSISEGVSVQKMILDGRVLQQDAQSEMMGMPFEGLGMAGFDNLTGKYWATWMDSMSTSCFMSQGSYDEASDSVISHGEYEDPMGGALVKVRTVSREESADQHVFEWFEDRDGEEMKTMEIVYTRQ